jgi:uncharacterized membrane protein YqjE
MGPSGPNGAPAPGVVDSIRSFMASWVAVIKTRVEIVSLEIEEQREWMQQIVLLAVGALFCVSLGMILLTLLVVVAFWDTQGRLWVIGGFALLYLGGGTGLGLYLRHKLKSKPRIFSATAGELGKDYASLQPRAP